MPKSQMSHSTRFSDMTITESPLFTPASIRADATESTSCRIAFQLFTLHASPMRWWIRARSPYFAACRKKTPTVVRSEIPSGSISIPVVAVVLSADVLLLDRLDGQCQRSRRHADCHLVALLLADQGAAYRRVHRDAARGRVALDGADQVVRLALTLVVDDLDGRARLGDARVCVLDDLGPADHLLQLVD